MIIKRLISKVLSIIMCTTVLLEPIHDVSALVEVTNTKQEEHQCSPNNFETVINKTVVSAGEEVRIEFSADGISGDDYELKSNYTSDSYNQHRLINADAFEFNSERNTYIAILNISEKTLNGEYRLNEARLICKECNNHNMIWNHDIRFEVVGNEATQDLANPIIEDVILERGTFTTGDKVKISIKAYDEDTDIGRISINVKAMAGSGYN